MMIAPQRVVSLHYVLSDDCGQVLDDSKRRQQPLEYLHGHDNILAGLEHALSGHEAGDAIEVILPPAEAYGERDEALVREVGRDAFPVEVLSPGMRFQSPGDDGPEIVTVLDVSDDRVRIDTNHPLAGQSLHYRLEVLEVREAGRAELAKGHPLPPDVEPSQVEDRKAP
ncbi:FKBP-type peptidyl-prolyl cis-trans isomerase [Billgrantia gudaonensis]|uniref:Peptidyl-prolyl cis-trans isomerase n=1 Tax=Billgrantia gudaonensis TaxID=376427 RepID=A0A1G8NGY9_9GAMM|nr:peptidylprolyl isomerase [Halomonas gudaonensis]SDI79541.1 FKBP-type peptidyl-prolyl cis-trans isomerase SlyD [Halomonas gudaonensis]